MIRFRYRRISLLLMALILPILAIAWLGWEVLGQQRQIDAGKQKDDRQRIASEIGDDIVRHLDRIKLQEGLNGPSLPGDYSDPAIAVVGNAENGRLVFPWDTDPNEYRLAAARFDRAIKEPAFETKVNAASSAEYRDNNYTAAAEAYQEIATTVSDPNQRAYARRGQARNLQRSGKPEQSLEVWRDVLNLSSDIADINGPIALSYAADFLLSQGRVNLERAVLERVLRDIHTTPTIARGDRFLRPLLDRLAKSTDATIRAQTAAAEFLLSTRMKALERGRSLAQAQRLRTFFQDRGVTSENWSAFSGDEAWLVGMTPNKVVIAVRVEDVRKSVEADRLSKGKGLKFQLVADGSGEPLSESLRGLRVSFPTALGSDSSAGLSLQQRFIAMSLLFVVGLALLGGYLLWRDVRREVHMAELRSQFVSSVSHELKTPLTAIRMFAETLQMREDSDPKTRSEYMDTIVNETERLTRLLNNVLDFSRIERGQKNYHMQPAALEDVVRAVVRTMRFPLSEQGFDLSMNVSAEIPPMPLDRDALEQAVLNLLSNAMKYSGKSRDIEVRLNRRNGNALIQVEDHGVGIPEEEQKRIFEKFYRVPTPENRAISGTGLGLALVAHIAEAHGGSVEVESKVGEGSTFSISLPLPSVVAREERAHELGISR